MASRQSIGTKKQNRKNQGAETPKRQAGRQAAQQDDEIRSANATPMEVDEPERSANNDDYEDLHVSEDEEGGKRVCGIYIPPPIPAYCSTASKGPRLIIKKIVNYNFKSYAGIVELGPFHHCFTAIIGPNGSGKSNVIDSMLFVFGYRANRIRCKKVSTLIHNSNKHQNVRECYVAIHFVQIEDLDDGRCVEVNNSSFVIKRNAFNDNTSAYFIDSKKVKFNDVAKLLKTHNVDLDHNRFLILQGEVESIAMMKPKGQTESECGMLEYLEDIIGTNRYIKPLEQLNEMVNKLSTERAEKYKRFRLVETEVNDMKGPYDTACNYLKEENKNTHTLNKIYQKNVLEIKKKLEKIKEKHEEANKKLQEHDTEAESLSNERKDKEAIANKENIEHSNLGKKVAMLQKKIDACTKSFNEVQSEMEAMNSTRKKNKTLLEKQEKELITNKKQPESIQNEMDECTKKIEQLSKQKTELESELEKNSAATNEQILPLRNEINSLTNELIPLNVDRAKTDVKCSEEELKVARSSEVTAARKYQTLKCGYESAVQNHEELKTKHVELKEQIPELKKEIITKTNLMKQKKCEEQSMCDNLMKIREEINRKGSMAESRRSNNRILNFIMQQKDSGQIPGILGRLGDLGGIDAKYDVAISTACGRLDNIVVETVDAAQQCIQALRKHDVGRANFIALEKIQHYAQYMGRIQTPENAPRLFDLVRVEDQRVLPAFYFALHDTLVANDLDQSSRIAYGAKRFRVVTLMGELIETSGTMSGGGRVQIRGKMGTQVQTKTKPTSADDSIISQKALDDMRASAQDLQNKINFCQQEQGCLDDEIKQLKSRLARVEKEFDSSSASIRNGELHLPVLLKQLNEHEEIMKKTKTDSQKVKQIEAEIERKKEALKKVESQAEKIHKKIAEVEEKIDKILGENVNPLKKKLSSLDSQLKKLTDNVTQLKKNLKNKKTNIEKLEASITRLKAEIEESQEKIKQLNEDRGKYDAEAEEISKELEETKKALEVAKKASSSILKEIDAIKKKESELGLKRYEIEKAVTDLVEKIKEKQFQIPAWQSKIQPLRLNEIPNEPNIEPLKTYTDEELEAMDLNQLQYTHTALEETLKKKPNLSIIEEYQEKIKVLYERQDTYMQVVGKLKDMRDTFDEVRKNRYKEFTNGFRIISSKLKEMYQMITQGGDAELEMVDSMDPFTEGINFSVRPPRKSWKIISNLSGGEKTLSSLALVFALHYYKPSPLYFMDEIDAALDFKNISIVAHYIKERTKNAQFIIISLRNNMFELSDYLVGIYKTQDCTNSVTIKNEYVPLYQQLRHARDAAQQQKNLFEDSSSSEDIAEHEQSEDLNQFTLAEMIPPMQPIINKRLTAAHLMVAVAPQKPSSNQTSSGFDNQGSPKVVQQNPAPSRDTTFMPSSESTNLSQNIASNLTTENSITMDQVVPDSIPQASNDGFKIPPTPEKRPPDTEIVRMEQD